jgi:hypothetical protein
VSKKKPRALVTIAFGRHTGFVAGGSGGSSLESAKTGMPHRLGWLVEVGDRDIPC